MHKEDVKARIRKQGKTLRELSIEAGLAEATVCISLKKPLPTANIYVADFLGLSLNDIWPEWYDNRGNRIYQQSLSFKNTKQGPKSHCQKTRSKSTEGKVHEGYR